jgi:hypothetical protein
LRAVAEHAALRVALYRRRTNLGRGEPRRLAELERIAKDAADRLRRARTADSAPPRRRESDLKSRLGAMGRAARAGGMPARARA